MRDIFPPVFQAHAILLISEEQPYIAFPPPPGNFERYLQNQHELIRSDRGLGAALAQPELQKLSELREIPDPIAFLRDHLEFTPIGSTGLYQVTFTSPSPHAAAAIANAIAAEYLRFQENEELQHSQFLIEVLESERRSRNSEVRDLYQTALLNNFFKSGVSC